MDEDRIAQNSSHARMDHLLERIQTLEQHAQSLQQQTISIARRLRWWRRLACGVMVLAIFSLPLSLGADDRRHDDRKGEKHRGHFNSKHDKDDDKDDKELRKLRERIRALERKLQHVTSERDENGLPAFVITGANLRIVNGLGRTDCADEQGNPISGCPNGLGNLIVGYNERLSTWSIHTGSHNIVGGGSLTTSPASGGWWLDSPTRSAGCLPQSAVGSTTQAAATPPRSAEGAATPPVASPPRSAEAAATPPAVSTPRSAGGLLTRPVELLRGSAAV